MPAIHTQSIHLMPGDRITVERAELHDATDGGFTVLDVGGVEVAVHARDCEQAGLDLIAAGKRWLALADHEFAIGRAPARIEEAS